MPQSILAMAKDLVMAQIEAGRVSPEDMQHALQQTYTSLSALKMQEERDTVGGVEGNGTMPTPSNWKKSIARLTVTCLECGATFKQLSTRHLRDHGMDARAYRAKYGIPRTQALAAKETTARRKRLVAVTRPWEKTPRYREAKERTAPQVKAAAPPAKKQGTRRVTKRQAAAPASD